MSSTVSLGQVIGIIGGIPILKNVLGHTIDHLKIPRHLDIGTTPSILSAVLSGGAGAFLQSPLGAALAPLTSALSTAQVDVTSTLGDAGATLKTALGNLSTSATSLSALADNLIGLTANTSLPSQLDLIAQAGVAQSLGSALPSNLSLATVLAPVNSAALMTSAFTDVQPVVTQALAGTMTVADAVTATEAIQSSLDAVTNASTNAITTVQAAQPALCAAQSAIALLVAGPAELTAAMTAAIQPDMLAAAQAIVTAHNEALAVAAAAS